MRIMCRRHCVKYVLTLMTMCLIVGLYMAAIKHNRDVHKRFHIKRLKVKRDIHAHVPEFRKRVTNMKPIKEPPHVDRYKIRDTVSREVNTSINVYIVEEHHEG